MKAVIYGLAVLGLILGGMAIAQLDWPTIDVRSGDQVKAVIVDPDTGDVLQESEPINVR